MSGDTCLKHEVEDWRCHCGKAPLTAHHVTFECERRPANVPDAPTKDLERRYLLRTVPRPIYRRSPSFGRGAIDELAAAAQHAGGLNWNVGNNEIRIATDGGADPKTKTASWAIARELASGGIATTGGGSPASTAPPAPRRPPRCT